MTRRRTQSLRSCIESKRGTIEMRRYSRPTTSGIKWSFWRKNISLWLIPTPIIWGFYSRSIRRISFCSCRKRISVWFHSITFLLLVICQINKDFLWIVTIVMWIQWRIWIVCIHHWRSSWRRIKMCLDSNSWFYQIYVSMFSNFVFYINLIDFLLFLLSWL